jgi:taurine dioxygenase
MTTVEAAPLAGFGAEVTGLDIGKPLDAEEQRRLNELFDDHRLLLFRNVDIDVDAHARLVSYIGPVETQQHNRIPSYVSNVRTDATPALQAGPLRFHSDYAFTPTPLAAISLYAEDVAEGSTTTHFADGVIAALRLDEGVRQKLRGLTARHLYDPADVPGHNADGLRRGERNKPPDAEEAIHPVLLAHRRTPAEVLYVSEAQTVAIEDVPRDESNALLDELFAVLYAPAHEYEHHWATGDLVVWDNVALQHARGTVERNAPRTLRRIVIGGGWR